MIIMGHPTICNIYFPKLVYGNELNFSLYYIERQQNCSNILGTKSTVAFYISGFDNASVAICQLTALS